VCVCVLALFSRERGRARAPLLHIDLRGNLSDAKKFRRRIFLLDRLQRATRENMSANLVHTRLEVGAGVVRVSRERRRPVRLIVGLESQGDAGRRDGRGHVLEHAVLLKHTFAKVESQLFRRIASAAGLEVAFGEDHRGGNGELETQRVENQALHLQNLSARVGAIGDVHKISNFREVDLLVLGGEEHAGHADELQSLSGDDFALQKSVDEIDRQIQGLGHQLEFEMYLDEPIDEDRSHLGVDVRLFGHVAGGRAVESLDAAKVGHDIVDVLGDGLRIFPIDGVNVFDLNRRRSRRDAHVGHSRRQSTNGGRRGAKRRSLFLVSALVAAYPLFVGNVLQSATFATHLVFGLSSDMCVGISRAAATTKGRRSIAASKHDLVER